MVFDIFTLVEGFWLLLPAYAANGLAPLIKFKSGLHPIDGGRQWRGRPLLGRGKTWEGLFLGVFVAVIISLVQMTTFPFLPWALSEVHGVILNIVPMSAALGLLLGLGAMCGDLVASFLKRRIRLPRGAPAPILDQDDFVLGAFIFASLLVAVETSWLILYLVITPLFHWIACFIGFRLGVKKTPW
ncbi:MAG: CDP-2,3-bis-(O-geranylgeranyl)-sn-glycerol synthase [Candidatus Aenigmarchaeota archaeon]|nr:CDP-2,3-bis-(O-geranylgeranyl)-sn-glycerol synthase [Candidatus Aenigmarchaeota archaeon]